MRIEMMSIRVITMIVSTLLPTVAFVALFDIKVVHSVRLKFVIIMVGSRGEV
jgi:hypothetical protein